ncbi:MAG TPA: hypothetical protein VGD81_14985 [Opitutaceae bacterium]
METQSPGSPRQRGTLLGRSAATGRHRARFSDKRGLTIVEVAMAAAVLALTITTSIAVLQQGFRAIDTARATTIAGQVLQSMIEDVRLLNWAQTEALPASQSGTIDRFYTNAEIALSYTDYSEQAAAALSRFTFERTVSPMPDGQSSMKVIVLTARWTGVDGREHALSYTTYYAEFGLYDYYHS